MPSRDTEVREEADVLSSSDSVGPESHVTKNGQGAVRLSPSDWLGPLPENMMEESLDDESPRALPLEACSEDPVWEDSMIKDEEYFPSLEYVPFIPYTATQASVGSVGDGGGVGGVVASQGSSTTSPTKP